MEATRRGWFWYPAEEPTSSDLEDVVHKTVARNIFCARHVSALQEWPCWERVKGPPRTHRQDVGEWIKGVGDKQEDNATFRGTVALLVKSLGLRQSAYRGSEYTRDARAPSPFSAGRGSCCESGGASSVQHGEGMGEAVDPPSQPLGFLGTLIEAARTKERGRALEAVRRDGAGDVGGAGVRHSRGNAVRGGFACDPRQDTPEQDGDGNVEFSVSLPSGSSAVPDSHDERGACSAAKHPLQMSREEFLAQFKRAPRRGEIGYDAASVAAAESLGYVMSGSRDREKQHYIDSIQHKLHEKEARKLRLHFRKVEDERNDSATVETLLALMRRKTMREERDE